MKHGLDVKVLTFQMSPLSSLRDTVDGIPVIRMRLPKLKMPGMAEIILLCYLLKYHSDYDIIHNHVFSTYTLVCSFVSRLFQKSVIVKFANSGNRNDLLHESQRLPWLSKYFRKTLCNLDAVIAICNIIQKELRQQGVLDNRLHLIPNGVETDVFTPSERMLNQKYRKELGLPAGAIIILRVGTLLSKKGMGILLEAWDSLALKFPDLMLLSVGGDNLPKELEQVKSYWDGRVKLVFNVENILPYYQVSDIFVLPSFIEGLSNALIEAQACGLPSVVSKVGGNPEVVIHGDNGLVVEPGKADKLEAALAILVNDQGTREQMGNRARELSARYDMSNVVQQYITLYQQLVNRDRRP